MTRSAKPKSKLKPYVSRRGARHEKGVNIALQGGGAHGAFTWGVLDKLFEDDRIWIEAISGTSAGALNAVVAAHGMHKDGARGARKHLRKFWKAASEAAALSPFRRSLWNQFTSNWSLNNAPGYLYFEMMRRIASPYDFNPFDYNPMREIVEELVDFERVTACMDMGLFISATNVETGRVRVFDREEITIESVMASSCLPYLYKAVEIDGQSYWDGGFMGNPPLFPFFYNSPSNDIVIVQINPILREGVPRSAQDIQNRMDEITYNSALLHELRSIDFVKRLIERGKLEATDYRNMNIHIIEARKKMRPLDASSKLNAEWDFFLYLFEIGREAADKWLRNHFDDLGVCSSVDVRQMFQGFGALPDK